MPTPDARATARRNLAYRIDRFLREQDGKPAITGWQADRLLVAMHMLEAGRCPEGEDVMRDAEKPHFEPAGYVSVGRHEPGRLMERLAVVLAE